MAIDLNTLKKAEGELNKNSAYSYGSIYDLKKDGYLYSSVFKVLSGKRPLHKGYNWIKVGRI